MYTHYTYLNTIFINGIINTTCSFKLYRYSLYTLTIVVLWKLIKYKK